MVTIAPVPAHGMQQRPVTRDPVTTTAPAARDTVSQDTVSQSIVPLPTTPVPRLTADSLHGPPLSPRRALLYSVLLPGYGQSRLDRPKASMLFAVAEVFAIGMARKAAQDLQQAKRASKDSIPIGYETVDGELVPTGYQYSRFTPERIKARRTHYEDWIAAILFNHLISGVDAFVAANLWDFRTMVESNPATGTTNIGLRRAW